MTPHCGGYRNININSTCAAAVCAGSCEIWPRVTSNVEEFSLAGDMRSVMCALAVRAFRHLMYMTSCQL